MTGLPTFVDNDAKALALGEGWVGAAVGYDDYLTAELPLYPTYPDQMVFDTANHLARIIAGE